MTKPTKKPKRRVSKYNRESTRIGRDDHKRKKFNPGPWKSPEPRPWEAILGPDKPAPRAKGIQ